MVFLEALALYSTSWIVYGLFLGFYAGITIFVAFDCYYIGIGRMDYIVAWNLAKDILCNWKPVRDESDQTDGSSSLCSKFQLSKLVRFPIRFTFALIFCAVNFALGCYILASKIRDQRKNVSHLVLLILAGNLMLYLLYYIIRKIMRNNLESEFIIKTNRQRLHFFNDRISIPAFNSGMFFAILAFVFGIIAIYFYLQRAAHRNLTPAQSRNLNAECSFMEFYDNHDMWHFFSAAGVFTAFLALLTVDDDLLFVPRDNIDVF